MSSYLTRNREFKKIANKLKKLKNTIIAFFQAKISWEWPKMRENKKNRSDQFFPDSEQRITKKLKNTIMASFQAKLRRERLGKNINKKNRSDEFLSDPESGIPKKQQRNSKN